MAVGQDDGDERLLSEVVEANTDIVWQLTHVWWAGDSHYLLFERTSVSMKLTYGVE